MKINIQILQILILILGSYLVGVGQKKRSAPKSTISTEYFDLISKIDNRITIVAQQANPVSLNQLSAFIQVYNSEKEPIEIVEVNGYFIIHPDTIGLVEIHINLGDTIETKTIRVKPIKVVGHLGGAYGYVDKQIGIGEFRAQRGISAVVICCGFDLKCKVERFETIRINRNDQVERDINVGARFMGKVKEMILKAESEDVYIFRNIQYRCPDSQSSKKLDDMIFEIK